MATDEDGQALVSRLLEDRTRARLDDLELGLLRTHLEPTLKAIADGEAVQNTYQLRRLMGVLAYNDHLRRCDMDEIPSSVCEDARTLLAFVSEADALTQAIDDA